jgi:XTP/dITP diphosphohydrolase
VEIQSHDLAVIASFAADEISSERSGMVAVEDSGLFISSLSGFPGPYTAYAHKTIGIPGILKLLQNSSDRRADFKAAVAVSRSGRTLQIFTGQIDGTIAKSQRGKNGFGFDPIFIPIGKRKTFGEMSGSEKNERSHRQRALKKLAEWYLAL